MTSLTATTTRAVRDADSGIRHDLGLAGTLNRQWDRELSHTPIPRTWALEHHGTLGALLDQLGAGTTTARDTALHRLLSLAAQGDALAARVLVQVMLGKVVRLSRTAAVRGLQDPFETVLAALWDVIYTYPLHRHESITGNLALETLHRLPQATHEIPSVCVELDPQVPGPAYLHLAGPDTDPSDQVAATLAWAQDAHVLSDDDVLLIARATLSDDAETLNLAKLAQEWGLPHATLRKRYARAVTRLATAVRQHLSEDPHPAI